MKTRIRSLVALALLAGAAPLAGCKPPPEPVVAPPPPPPPPPADTDKDGIIDDKDPCPTVAEDGLPPVPDDGCPTTDPDKDGIEGDADKCPTEPETVNGYEDTDGCPDEVPLVEVKAEEIKINQKIMFSKDKAEITADSMKVVEAVATVLKEHPEIELVEIGGHASEEGPSFYNQQLTQKRVDAVVTKLVELGVDKGRLIAQGYGYYCPTKTGAKTEEEHEVNRRVEFKILRKSGTLTWAESERGCELARKKKIVPKPVEGAPPPPKEPEAAPATAPASSGAPAAPASAAPMGSAAPAP